MARPAPPLAQHLPQRALAAGIGLHLLAWALSFALHVAGALPLVVYTRFAHLYDLAGEDGPEDDRPTGDEGGPLLPVAVPVQVSVYTERARASTPPAAAAPRPAPSTSKTATGTADKAVEGEATEGGPAMANQREARLAETRTLKEGTSQGAPPRGKKKPCEQIEEIVKLDETTWRVERDLLDWYATHLRELEKQVGVSSYRDEDGKRGGARLYLPRCSVLRQGGMRNGDVVRTVNGRKVNTVAQGVATWLAVRGQKTVVVELTRKEGQDLVHTYHLK